MTDPPTVRCPGCHEPLETIVWNGFTAATQAYDVATEEWGTTDFFFESEHATHYECGDCATELPPRIVKQFAIPPVNRTARRLLNQ